MDKLVETGHFKPTFQKPFFNEFCVEYDGDVDVLQKKFVDNGFLGGVKMGDHTIMFAVTEQRSKEEIDNLIKLI